jgi:phosphatidylserine/phosphatidylglycerophosphate/cardiolipin synthase-like enzyme
VDALIQAAARGVHVRVLLEGGEEFMDEAMIKGNRETAAFLMLHGVEVRLDPLGETTHAKCLVVDGEDILVSSANWSYYSLEHNVEAGVAILAAPELASLLCQFFEGLWAGARALSWEPYLIWTLVRSGL